MSPRCVDRLLRSLNRYGSAPVPPTHVGIEAADRVVRKHLACYAQRPSRRRPGLLVRCDLAGRDLDRHTSGSHVLNA